MKKLKTLIQEYLDKSNSPNKISGMVLLTKFECELLMEQHAEESAIDFADWMMKEGWRYHYSGRGWFKVGDTDFKSTQELYKMFKNSSHI